MSISRPITVLFRLLLACLADGRSRRALLSLDDRLLRDIDVTRSDAKRAAKRPLWMRSRSRMGNEFTNRHHAGPAFRKAPEW
ncbi:MAG: DUF1127 domain-containing protein [Alphaproteobacteria bacterium]|nr:DUF1127 domain-containing protein [Alphaproteobacteria bacterium]